MTRAASIEDVEGGFQILHKQIDKRRSADAVSPRVMTINSSERFSWVSIAINLSSYQKRLSLLGPQPASALELQAQQDVIVSERTFRPRPRHKLDSLLRRYHFGLLAVCL